MNDFWAVVDRHDKVVFRNNGLPLIWRKTSYWSPEVTAEGWAHKEAMEMNERFKEVFVPFTEPRGFFQTKGEWKPNPNYPYRAAKVTVKVSV